MSLSLLSVYGDCDNSDGSEDEANEPEPSVSAASGSRETGNTSKHGHELECLPSDSRDIAHKGQDENSSEVHQEHDVVVQDKVLDALPDGAEDKSLYEPLAFKSDHAESYSAAVDCSAQGDASLPTEPEERKRDCNKIDPVKDNSKRQHALKPEGVTVLLDDGEVMEELAEGGVPEALDCTEEHCDRADQTIPHQERKEVAIGQPCDKQATCLNINDDSSVEHLNISGSICAKDDQEECNSLEAHDGNVSLHLYSGNHQVQQLSVVSGDNNCLTTDSVGSHDNKQQEQPSASEQTVGGELLILPQPSELPRDSSTQDHTLQNAAQLQLAGQGAPSANTDADCGQQECSGEPGKCVPLGDDKRQCIGDPSRSKGVSQQARPLNPTQQPVVGEQPVEPQYSEHRGDSQAQAPQQPQRDHLQQEGQQQHSQQTGDVLQLEQRKKQGEGLYSQQEAYYQQEGHPGKVEQQHWQQNSDTQEHYQQQGDGQAGDQQQYQSEGTQQQYYQQQQHEQYYHQQQDDQQQYYQQQDEQYYQQQGDQQYYQYEGDQQQYYQQQGDEWQQQYGSDEQHYQYYEEEQQQHPQQQGEQQQYPQQQGEQQQYPLQQGEQQQYPQQQGEQQQYPLQQGEQQQYPQQQGEQQQYPQQQGEQQQYPLQQGEQQQYPQQQGDQQQCPQQQGEQQQYSQQQGDQQQYPQQQGEQQQCPQQQSEQQQYPQQQGEQQQYPQQQSDQQQYPQQQGEQQQYPQQQGEQQQYPQQQGDQQQYPQQHVGQHDRQGFQPQYSQPHGDWHGEYSQGRDTRHQHPSQDDYSHQQTEAIPAQDSDRRQRGSSDSGQYSHYDTESNSQNLPNQQRRIRDYHSQYDYSSGNYRSSQRNPDQESFHDPYDKRAGYRQEHRRDLRGSPGSGDSHRYDSHRHHYWSERDHRQKFGASVPYRQEHSENRYTPRSYIPRKSFPPYSSSPLSQDSPGSAEGSTVQHSPRVLHSPSCSNSPSYAHSPRYGSSPSSEASREPLKQHLQSSKDVKLPTAQGPAPSPNKLDSKEESVTDTGMRSKKLDAPQQSTSSPQMDDGGRNHYTKQGKYSAFSNSLVVKRTPFLKRSSPKKLREKPRGPRIVDPHHARAEPPKADIKSGDIASAKSTLSTFRIPKKNAPAVVAADSETNTSKERKCIPKPEQTHQEPGKHSPTKPKRLNSSGTTTTSGTISGKGKSLVDLNSTVQTSTKPSQVSSVRSKLPSAKSASKAQGSGVEKKPKKAQSSAKLAGSAKQGPSMQGTTAVHKEVSSATQLTNVSPAGQPVVHAQKVLLPAVTAASDKKVDLSAVLSVLDSSTLQALASTIQHTLRLVCTCIVCRLLCL